MNNPGACESDRNHSGVYHVPNTDCLKEPHRFKGPLRILTWNARSLWAKGRHDTRTFALNLAQVVDVAIFTETRETDTRAAHIKQLLPLG